MRRNNLAKRSNLRVIAFAAVALLIAGACGQKPGVADQGTFTAGQLPEGTVINEETGEVIDAETGEVVGTVGDPTSPGTGPGGGGTTTNTTTSGGPGGSTTTPGAQQTQGPGNDGPDNGDSSNDDGNGQQPESPQPGAGGNTTGVSPSTIKIGIHAPVTGAAPVPQNSFREGTTLFWDYLRRTGQSINGRDVEVVFEDDQYNPSTAVDKCQKMVEEDKVFLLIGIAGADQITACARYAASVGVPYLSAGVNESGLTNLPTYFALWMSYNDQAYLLADLLKTRLRAGSVENAMVYFDTSSFADARSGFDDAMGSTDVYFRPVPKTAGAADAQSVATELNSRGIENVYVLTSPTFFLQLANATGGNYNPQWVGVGLSMTIDTVAKLGCDNGNSIDDARFFSPFPAYSDSDRFDPKFRQSGGRDDIQFGLWGASKLAADLLKATGKDLSRERFIYTAERSQAGGTQFTGSGTAVLPPIKYAPGDRLGGSKMHLNRADCSRDVWLTEKPFVSGF